MADRDMPEETIDRTLRGRFESAWLAGQPEPIERLLPAESDAGYLGTLEELVELELMLAWQSWSQAAGRDSTAIDEETVARPALVESYLERFPRLKHPEIILRLLMQECAARRQCGEDASVEEYRRRFPEVVVSEEQLNSAVSITSLPSRPAALAETLATGLPGGTTAVASPLAEFGNYESLEEIGRGGMGIVYRARQRTADRVVALKVIRRDRLEQLPMDTYSKALDRFRQEAQAAARLEHENIVTVYEVGEVQGQPFFSMRYVEGRSLSEILHGGPMDNRRAAAYLEPVARAVHEAHCQGILHRDLKPQNILVDKKTDHALVADFGLAKFSEGTDEITRAGEVMGTPSYMSPEQAKDSASVTAKTDVYALGATLYHMLTARPPFQAATPVETLRQVIDEQPAPPRQLNPSIDRDLETICLKCLEKEPSRRYDSAAALADDLGRYQRGEPIRARPIGVPARIWRWCRREPALATAIGLAATFFLAGSITSTVLLFETRSALEQSEESFSQAVATVDDFLTLVGEETLLNEPGMQPLRRKLLAKARDYYQEFLSQRGNDPTIRDKVALAHFRVGLVTEKIDSPEKALASYRLTCDMQEQLADECSDDEERLRECLWNLGNTYTAIGAVLGLQDQLADAQRAHQQAVAVREQLAENARPDETEYPRTLANSYMNLGIIEMKLGLIAPDEETAAQELEKAQRHLLEAQDVRQRLLTRVGDHPKTRRDLAKGYFNLAYLAMAVGDAETAEDSINDAIAVFRKLLEEDAKVLANQSDLATCYRALGDLFSGIGRAEEAENAYQEALVQMEGLVRANPAVPSYRSALAGLYMNIGQLHGEQGESEAARRAFGQAREILEPLVDGYPDVSQYRLRLAVTLREAALLESSGGDSNSIQKDLELARGHLERLVRESPENTEYQGQLAATEAALGMLSRISPVDE